MKKSKIDFQLMVADRFALLYPSTLDAVEFAESTFGKKYTVFCGCILLKKKLALEFFNHISEKGFSIVKINNLKNLQRTMI